MTAANVVTLLRIVLVPVFAGLWITGHRGAALAVFAVASLSDLLDGLLARLLDQRSRLGAILDPAADKLMLFVSFLVAALLGVVPAWLAALVIGRDVILSAGAFLLTFVFHLRYDTEQFHPTRIGKYATVFQLATITLALVTQLLGDAGPWAWLSSLVLVTATFTLASGIQYVSTGINALIGSSGRMLPQSPDPTRAA